MDIFSKTTENRKKLARRSIKSTDEMSTLELWQAHLRALRRASNSASHKTDVLDTDEQKISSLVVDTTNTST